MSDTSLPPLRTMTFTPYGAPKAIRFNNLAEVDAWVHAQQAAWKPFHDLGRSVSGEHRDSLFAAVLAVQKAKSNETPETLSAVIAALRRLEHLPYLAVEGPGVSYLLDVLGKLDNLSAEEVFKFLIGGQVWANTNRGILNLTPLLRTAASWRDGDRGSSVQAASFKKDMNERLGKWEGQFSTLQKSAAGFLEQAGNASSAVVTRQEELLSAIETLKTDSAQQLGDLAAAHAMALSDLHAERKEQLEGLHRDWDAALAHIEKTYTDFMRLKAPADYWMHKAAGHKTMTHRWLIALLSLLGVGLVGVVWCYVCYLYDWIDHLAKPNAGTVGAVLVGLPVLMYLSLVKVAHKSYRDQARFAADAEQRTTLVQTYLALVHENDGGVQGGERLLALHALFRGSAQADGPDDTPPINTLEALVQGLKPKTS